MEEQKGISCMWKLHVGSYNGRAKRYPNRTGAYTHNLSLGYGYGYTDEKFAHPQNVEVDWKSPWKKYAILKQIYIFIPSQKPGDILGKHPRMFPPYYELEDSAQVQVDLINHLVTKCSYGMAKQGPLEIKWFYPFENLDVTVWTRYPFLAEAKLFVEEFEKEKE